MRVNHGMQAAAVVFGIAVYLAPGPVLAQLPLPPQVSPELAGSTVQEHAGRLKAERDRLTEEIEVLKARIAAPRAPAYAIESRLKRVLTGHARPIYSVAFLPNGLLLSGDDGGELKVWSAASGEELRAVTAHSGWVTSIIVSPRGNAVATTGNDGVLMLWSLPDLRKVWKVAAHPNGAHRAIFAPDGGSLYSGGSDGVIRAWSVAGGRLLSEARAHENWVSWLSVSRDGGKLASAGDTTVRLWSAPNLEAQHSVLRGHEGVVRTVAFSPDGMHIATSSRDRTLRLWETASGKPLRSANLHDWPVAMSYSPDGKLIATAGRDNVVTLWEAGELARLTTVASHDDWVKALAWSPDGRLLASGGSDRKLKIHEIRRDLSAP